MRAMISPRPKLFAGFVLAALVALGCSSRDLEGPSEDRTGTVSSPDAKAAARAEAVLGIRLTLSFATEMRASLKLAPQGTALGISGDQVKRSLETALQVCQLFAQRYESRVIQTLDLWPAEFRSVWRSRQAACDSISSRSGWDALLRQPDYCQCLLLEFVALTPLSEALAAVPDYSDAQLNRAIADRQ